MSGLIFTHPGSLMVGTVVKTLTVYPYEGKSLSEVVHRGVYHSHDRDIYHKFAGIEVALVEPATVNLVQFDKYPYYEELLVWVDAQKPIMPKHLFGIGIQYPEEQCHAPIAEIGSMLGNKGSVLCIGGHAGWRYLNCYPVQSSWDIGHLFGFLSE